jgi:hypothetical protein
MLGRSFHQLLEQASAGLNKIAGVVGQATAGDAEFTIAVNQGAAAAEQFAY